MRVRRIRSRDRSPVRVRHPAHIPDDTPTADASGGARRRRRVRAAHRTERNHDDVASLYSAAIVIHNDFFRQFSAVTIDRYAIMCLTFRFLMPKQ